MPLFSHNTIISKGNNQTTPELPQQFQLVVRKYILLSQYLTFVHNLPQVCQRFKEVRAKYPLITICNSVPDKEGTKGRKKFLRQLFEWSSILRGEIGEVPNSLLKFWVSSWNCQGFVFYCDHFLRSHLHTAYLWLSIRICVRLHRNCPTP